MSHEFTRQELYDLVWSEPIQKLAKRFGLSDVGLAKACRSADIPRPGRGYWARLAAGKRVVKTALPPRGLGRSDRVTIGPRGRGYYGHSDEERANEVIAPPPAFPEGLEALTARVQRRVGRVTCPRLTRPHPLIAKVLETEEARRQEVLERGWAIHKPAHDGPAARRRLRLLNAVFLAANRCGCRPVLDDHDRLEAGVVVGDTRVPVVVAPIAGRTPRRREGAGGRPAEPLACTIGGQHRLQGIPLAWEDRDDAPLEQQLTEIVVGVLVAGEMEYRAALQRGYEWRLQMKEAAAERLRQRVEEAARKERERQRRLEQARVRHLLGLAGARRQAAQIRELVAAVSERAAGLADADERAALAVWTDWAMVQADRLDPLSGDALGTILALPDESVVADDD
ncbi:MAG: hypothetical protein ACM3O5_09245 [Betaproteobacteria bacterium]